MEGQTSAGLGLGESAELSIRVTSWRWSRDSGAPGQPVWGFTPTPTARTALPFATPHPPGVQAHPYTCPPGPGRPGLAGTPDTRTLSGHDATDRDTPPPTRRVGGTRLPCGADSDRNSIEAGNRRARSCLARVAASAGGQTRRVSCGEGSGTTTLSRFSPKQTPNQMM